MCEGVNFLFYKKIVFVGMNLKIDEKRNSFEEGFFF